MDHRSLVRRRSPARPGQDQRRLLAFRKGKIDPMYVRGKWYIAYLCGIDDPALIETTVGVEFGIINSATDSNGNSYSSFHTCPSCPKLTRVPNGGADPSQRAP
jgi:transposase